ncbi:MAG: hypothetical protein HC884_19780, partial [Chloroflexaceae bacterium]|nr:hypothetical protein [Chloroflexaceae bacterium]
MREVRKRYAVIVIALGLVALLSAACGGGEDGPVIETIVVTATPDLARLRAPQ